MTLLQAPQKTARKPRTRRVIPGVIREDSDDELGDDDRPWEWIREEGGGREEKQEEGGGEEKREEEDSTGAAAEALAESGDRCPLEVKPARRKRKRVTISDGKGNDKGGRIIGARTGDFACYLGDTVLLKAEGSNEAWVGLICEFVEGDGGDGDDDDDMAAHFMWFSTEREIRNKEKKRMDFLPNELYISPSWDINPLTSINGRATIMSPEAFRAKYPNGRVPRGSKDYGKVFTCRRGCNTRTASYTDEFVWEDIFHNTTEDIDRLVEMVKTGTKATRARRRGRPATAAKHDNDDAYELETAGADDDGVEGRYQTPRKKTRTFEAATPTSKSRSAAKLLTPSHKRVMVKKQLEFTPLARRTLSPSHYQASPFQQARSQLHVAAVPSSLPCRESEFALVYSHLEAAITEGTGSCIYISGTPGTGKTATVREVVGRLDAAVQADELDDFIFVEINGMKITDPHQAYALLWEALKGQRVSPGQALDLLEHEFSNPSPRRVPCVVLMDELDQLVTKNQGVMYNFFNWPGLRHSRLIVLAVANTMDLPERTLSNKISSRLGLTRITFPGYRHDQLMAIIESRLAGVPGAMVDADAIQFASRKVAAVSGDARRALDICRRAVELAEAESRAQGGGDMPPTPSKTAKQAGTANANAKAGRVTIETVRRAIAEATSSPLQQHLRALPFSSRLLLAALLARTQRTGVAESTWGDVLAETQRTLGFAVTAAAAGPPMEALLLGYGGAGAASAADDDKTARKQAAALAASRGVRLAGLGGAAVSLAGAGIIYLEAHRAERPSKIRLAVGDEDVRLAFRDDPEIKAVGLL